MLSTPAVAPSALSAEESAFYLEHGWVEVPPVIEDSLIEEARLGLEQHWSGHRDRRLPGVGQYFADWMPGDGEGSRNNEYLSLQNRRVSRLAWSPAIGAIAASATGAPVIRLFDDQMVYKPGGEKDTAVGWHVDGDYWQTCSSQDMLTAWIPLHDCPEEMGPLVVLDGSHRWSHQLDRSTLSFHSGDLEALRGPVEDLGYAFKPVSMRLRRGQFSLHHCRSIHGSHPNRSGSPRIALAVHLQDGGNRYRPAVRPDGRPVQLFNDRICRKDADGNPDYADDSVFPVLWSPSGRTVS